MPNWTRGAAACGLLSLAGCASLAPVYVSSTDPVLGICQQSAVRNLDSLSTAIDKANSGGQYGQAGATALSSDDISSAASTAQRLGADAALARGGHGGFADDLVNAAHILTAAAAAPGGYVSNSVAVAGDKYTAAVDNDCAAFTVGTAPSSAAAVRPSGAVSKPGPGLWSWGLFWAVLGAYSAMVVVASFVLARLERSRARADRLSGGGLIGYALAWPVTVTGLSIESWRRSLDRTRLSPAERRADAIAALEGDNETLRRKES